MQHYEQAVPGLGNQIMEMAKTEQRHQHQQDTKDFVIRLLGLIFAALMVFAVIGVSGYLIAMGNATQGTIFGSVSLVSLVGLYVYALRVVRIDRDKLNDTNGNNENEA